MISIHIWQKPGALTAIWPNSTASGTFDADVDHITFRSNMVSSTTVSCTQETHTTNCKLSCRAYLGKGSVGVDRDRFCLSSTRYGVLVVRQQSLRCSNFAACRTWPQATSVPQLREAGCGFTGLAGNCRIRGACDKAAEHLSVIVVTLTSTT